jgi:hypothetical protein
MALDLGVVLGAAGLAASGATVLYAHGQLKALRQQADEARRVAVLDSSREMLSRYQELRTRWLTHPQGLAGLLEVLPGLDAAIAQAGDMPMYLLFRDMLDTFQDIFFLRRAGIVSDDQWSMWRNNHMRSPVRAPGYQENFRYAAQRGLLHPDFVAFYEPFFQTPTAGQPPRA